MPEQASAHPTSVLLALREIPIVCPLCKQPLSAREQTYCCSPCGKTYPLHAGIPDFRVFPDPYLAMEEDRERTEFVLEALERLDFPSLLEAYWGVSDVTPEELRGKFIRSAMLGEKKAMRILDLLRGKEFDNDSIATHSVLEIGCGTGGFLATAMARFQTVVGIDIGMRWLHVSRRRFMDKGLDVPALVCCCAEHLPFPHGTFDQIVCSATLEFARDQDRVLSECARTMSVTGSAYFSTVNRFSLAQDPYVYLWGLGFLPRSWQARYVRYRRGGGAVLGHQGFSLLSLRAIAPG